MPSLKGSGQFVAQSVSTYQCSTVDLQSITDLCGGDAEIATQICNTVNVATLGVTNAVLQWTVGALQQAQDRETQLENGLNTAFVLQSAYQVFVMQAGFALYAAGVVRAKNTTMILLKNFMDACVASITFYTVGYAFAFGDKGNANGFIGNWDFALSWTSQQNPAPYAIWFWNWAFAAASTTILSGSIAERATFHSYLMYSFFMTIWVYPVVAHWIWAPRGWLSAHNTDSILGSGCIDFSGSGVVHMVGGFASIMGSLATGPRTGRFDPAIPVTTFKGSNPALYVLGTMLLWFGWYGFNPGSHLAISTYTLASGVSRTAVTTTLSAGAGAISAMLLSYYRRRTWDLLSVCTGCLAGLVAVTAGCGVITPWAAIICGAFAGPIYVYGEAWMEHMEIDDPVGAFPVHGLCGMWGVLFVGLLAKEQYVVEVYGKQYGKHLMGIFYGGHGQLLLCQFIAIIVIALWSSFWIGFLFFGMYRMGILRVPLEQEAQGMDGANCGDGASVNPKNVTKFSGGSLNMDMRILSPGNPLGGMKTGYGQVRNGGYNGGSPLITITEQTVHTTFPAASANGTSSDSQENGSKGGSA